MNAVTLTTIPKMVQESEHGVEMSRFKHGSFQLNIHPLSLYDHLGRYAAVVSLRLLLLAILVNAQ